MIRAALILGIAALVLMSPALIHGAPGIDSALYTQLWAQQYAQELARGVVYPRWLPQSFEGLGAPTFYFYPPLAFHLTGALATVMEVSRAVSWAGALMLFASGLAMYAWLRGKASELLAIGGALLYMAGPYHLTDFYVRSAQAEFGAFVWVPLIALAIENQRTRWGGPLLALAYAGLICTHLPVALLTSVVLIPALVLRAAWKDPAVAVRCALAGLAGVMVSALYLVPALTLQDHIMMPRIMWAAHFDIRNWSALGLLKDKSDPYLWPLSTLAAGWSAVALTAVLRGARFWPLLTLAAAVISLGLTPLFDLPILDRVQFPWRALAIVEFAAITAIVVWRPRAWWIALAALLLLPGVESFARVGRDALARDVKPAQIAIGLDAPEYLPNAFTPVPKARYPDGIEKYRGPLVRGAAKEVRASPDGSVVLTATADGPITIRRANFPRWQVQGATVEPGPLVTFQARAGQTYRLTAASTRAEVIGGWISLLGLILTLLLPAVERLRFVRDTHSRGT